ncbi:HPP family protein [Microbispora sp. NPDC049125]|uniref:CBS domain-containing protein n=1 Tax=Microbispora sp. NPDC049125 TaxID=3154929 RepID=UPI0034664FF3
MGVETMTAADVMSRTLVTVEPDESPLMAWELMRRAAVHHLPVVDAHSRVVGVLRREDLACHWTGGPAEQSRAGVRELLRDTRCPHAMPDTPLPELALLMIEADCGAVPVLGAEGTLEGLVTSSDVLAAVAGRGPRGGGPADVKGGLFRLEPVLPPRS